MGIIWAKNDFFKFLKRAYLTIIFLKILMQVKIELDDIRQLRSYLRGRGHRYRPNSNWNFKLHTISNLSNLHIIII